MATTFTPNLNLGKPAKADTGWWAEWNTNADKLDTILAKFWSEASSRLRLISQTPVYDIASNTIASYVYGNLGAVTPPDGKRVDLFRAVGTLNGAPADPNTKELYGYVFDLTNSATTGLNPTDNTRVRGLIGQVTVNGPGSGRAVHVTAAAGAGATSTSVITGGAFITIPNAAITAGRSKIFELSEQGGAAAAGLTDGIVYTVTSGSKFRYPIYIAGDLVSASGAAIFLTTNTTAGRILWSGNDYLWSPEVGSLEFVGTDAAQHYLRIVAANADTQDKGIIFRTRKGTVASPTAVASGNALANFYAQGYDGVGAVEGAGEVTAAYLTAIVDGTVTAGNVPGRFEFFTRQGGTLASRVKIVAGIQVGAPSGGDKGTGSANFAADIYKNNTAFTNPKWALQHYYTGQVDAEGPYAPPAPYAGLQSLEEVEAFMQQEHDLPLMRMVPAGGLFARGDLLLASLEEAYLYLLQLHRRVRSLERNLSGT